MAADFDIADTRDVNDFILEIEHARSFHELHFRAAEIANSYDFDFVCLLRLPLKQASDVNANLQLGNVPPAWLADDDGELACLIVEAVRKAGNGINFVHLDLTAQAALAPAGAPPDWSEVTDACFFPVHTVAGGRGVAVYLGIGRAARRSRMFELSYLSTLLFDRCDRLAGQDERAARLSRREIECLYWTAAGKTSAEIATILDLSEHTVNNYLVAVCQKLNSVNRVHAVAKAMRQGIIG